MSFVDNDTTRIETVSRADKTKITKAFLDQDILLPEHLVDVQLAAYLLNPSGSGYDALRLAQEYDIPTPSIPDDIPDPEAAVRAAVLPPLAEKLLGQVEQTDNTNYFTPLNSHWPESWPRWNG